MQIPSVRDVNNFVSSLAFFLGGILMKMPGQSATKYAMQLQQCCLHRGLASIRVHTPQFLAQRLGNSLLLMIFNSQIA